MTVKKKKAKTGVPIAPIRDSWEIWNHLKSFGLDPIYYDNEFLNGSASFNGLSHYLGFKVDQKTIVAQLQKHKVSAEKFITAFFKVLLPYAQMMNELCIFFANHKVNKTNESIRIVFDFGSVTDQLDFNLENFRSTLSSYTKVKKKVTFYHLPYVYSLLRILQSNGRAGHDDIKDKKARDWLKIYEAGTYKKPDLNYPVTGHEGLDFQLNRVIDLWSDFVTTCRDLTLNVKEFYSKLSELEGEEPDQENLTGAQPDSEALLAGWSFDNLRAESDRWTAFMVEAIFGRVEYINRLKGTEKNKAANELHQSLENYFDGLPTSEKELEDLVEDLTELLNLPIWKKRYELYSTWVMAAMDQALTTYNREVHHLNGVLRFNFSPTRLMTVQSAIGPFEIWAENRTLLSNPTGHGRKNAIQPDYTIYQGTIGDPNDCITCVEVKQYKKASVKNFKNALDDYADGLPKASIYLVNYGPVPANLSLAHPHRAIAFGGVQPVTNSLDTFKIALLSSLPLAVALTPEEIVKKSLYELLINIIYVDVSGSINKIIRLEYIRAFLKALLKRKKAQQLVAMDSDGYYEWQMPGEDDVDHLLLSHFDGGGDFGVELISDEGNHLVITDRSGAGVIWNRATCAAIIVVTDEEAELWVYDSKKKTHQLQATEYVEVSHWYPQKSFPGWL